jgi:DNA-directed RNA polymerase subunit RPC12/RpoP
MGEFEGTHSACTHCGSRKTELQLAGRTKTVHLCLDCGKTFEFVEDRRWQGAAWRKDRKTK